jgi:hypothetical protein
MALPRCPICNRYGTSLKYEGYCKSCYQARDENEKHAFADFTGTHDTGGFFPKDFGIVKKKFGYEER